MFFLLVTFCDLCYTVLVKGGIFLDWEKLKQEPYPIVLYGMGNGADRVLDSLAQHGLHAAGVFASDEFVRGQSFRGFPVLTYRQACERFGKMLVLLSFGTRLPEVLGRIERLSREQTLLCPDFPVAGTQLFTEEFFSRNAGRFSSVRALLADAQSRLVFDNTVQYKLSWDIRPLRACESSPDEAYTSILRLEPGEALADLGAYRGDTVADFVRFCPDYSEISAFEPDAYSYRHLLQNTASLPRCTCYALAVSDSDAPIAFSSRGGRGSGAGGETLCPADTVDHVLAGRRVSFLNIDVEGGERAAIAGAAELIRTQKPKLLVAAYHRSEDLFALCEQVLSLRPDYRVFLRHFPQLPAWETNFYFV